MKPITHWQQLTTLTTCCGLITVVLSVPAYAGTAVTPHELQLAQNLPVNFPNNCAEVAPPSGLYVHREPTAYSEAIGIVPYGAYLTAETGGTETWLPISAPFQGYVARGWVTPCYLVPDVRSVDRDTIDVVVPSILPENRF